MLASIATTMSMTDFFSTGTNSWLLPLAAMLALLIAWLVYRYVRRSRNSLQRVLNDIAVERFRGLVIPAVSEGEIQIDDLLLTANGLLILEVKEVQGVVFGSDKMQDWTVMSDGRRYTIPNPQPAMFDRIAAVRNVVRQVPVTARVLFMDGAEFTKGVPQLVCDLQQLSDEFSEPDENAAKSKTDAFRPYWERIAKAAISAESGIV
jgi:hypothetical protein